MDQVLAATHCHRRKWEPGTAETSFAGIVAGILLGLARFSVPTWCSSTKKH